MVISSIVNEVQMAYVESRQILDGPLIINETISWAKQNNRKLMVFKVDYDKAFDSINWNFLDSILALMGFGSTWRGWIKTCLKLAYSSVLVND